MPKWRNWTQKPVKPRRTGNLPAEFDSWGDFWDVFGATGSRQWHCQLCNGFAHYYRSDTSQCGDPITTVAVCGSVRSTAAAVFVRNT